jgi:hypothetical protein
MKSHEPILEVPVLNLRKVCNPIPNSPWGYLITERDIESAIENQEFRPDPHLTKRGKRYHIQRIAYLIVNGWNDPIDLDVGVPCLGCYIRWVVVDGNHRFFAAIVRGDNVIRVMISGQTNYAAELLGISIL